MDWLVAMCGREGFCMLLNWVKLLGSIDNEMWRQDTSNCLITSINLHDSLESSIEFGKDGS